MSLSVMTRCFYIPGLGFDGLVGYSPIAMAKNAIGMSLATEEYGATFLLTGQTPVEYWSIPCNQGYTAGQG